MAKARRVLVMEPNRGKSMRRWRLRRGIWRGFSCEVRSCGRLKYRSRCAEGIDGMRRSGEGMMYVQSVYLSVCLSAVVWYRNKVANLMFKHLYIAGEKLAPFLTILVLYFLCFLFFLFSLFSLFSLFLNPIPIPFYSIYLLT